MPVVIITDIMQQAPSPRMDNYPSYDDYLEDKRLSELFCAVLCTTIPNHMHSHIIIIMKSYTGYIKTIQKLKS